MEGKRIETSPSTDNAKRAAEISRNRAEAERTREARLAKLEGADLEDPKLWKKLGYKSQADLDRDIHVLKRREKAAKIAKERTWPPRTLSRTQAGDLLTAIEDDHELGSDQIIKRFFPDK